MTLANDIATSLINSGFATAKGTDIVAYQFTEAAANQICVIPMGGRDPLRYDAGNAIDITGLQIQVRNANMGTAESTAEAIRQALDNTSPTGYIYLMTTRSAPSYLGPDENGRHRFSVDFVIEKVR